MHNICNLAIEIQAAIQEYSDDKAHLIWYELLDIAFAGVNDPNDKKVDTALYIFRGLFMHIMDHLDDHKDTLGNIFQKTMQH